MSALSSADRMEAGPDISAAPRHSGRLAAHEALEAAEALAPDVSRAGPPGEVPDVSELYARAHATAAGAGCRGCGGKAARGRWRVPSIAHGDPRAPDPAPSALSARARTRAATGVSARADHLAMAPRFRVGTARSEAARREQLIARRVASACVPWRPFVVLPTARLRSMPLDPQAPAFFRGPAAPGPRTLADAPLPLPEGRRDLGCGTHLLDYEEAALLSQGWLVAQHFLPAPPVTYSPEWFAALGHTDTSPDAARLYLADRDRLWVEFFAMAFGTLHPRLPGDEEAARTLAEGVLGPLGRTLLTFEARVWALGDWLFRRVTGEWVLLDGASYEIPDLGGQLRFIGAWYSYFGAPDWFDDHRSDLRVLRLCLPRDAEDEPPPWPDDFSDEGDFPWLDRSDLDEIRAQIPGALTPPGEVRLEVRDDVREWPVDLHRTDGDPYPHFWPFDAEDRVVLDAIADAAEAAHPAPLHDIKDPRDGVSWAQKWRWLTAGGHDVGAEPTALLADYIHRTHNPGWLRVARAVEQSIPAVAVERTLRKISHAASPWGRSLAGFLGIHGEAQVVYLAGGGRALAPIGVIGWYRQPMGSWWNCEDTATRTPCTNEQWLEASCVDPCVERFFPLLPADTAAIMDALRRTISYHPPLRPMSTDDEFADHNRLFVATYRTELARICGLRYLNFAVLGGDWPTTILMSMSHSAGDRSFGAYLAADPTWEPNWINFQLTLRVCTCP